MSPKHFVSSCCLSALLLGLVACGDDSEPSGGTAGNSTDVADSGAAPDGGSDPDGAGMAMDGGDGIGGGADAGGSDDGGTTADSGATDASAGDPQDGGDIMVTEDELQLCSPGDVCVVVPYAHCCGSTKKAINQTFLDEYNSHPEWQSFNEPATCAVIGLCAPDNDITDAVCTDGSCALVRP